MPVTGCLLERIFSARLILARVKEDDGPLVVKWSSSPEANGRYLTADKISMSEWRSRLKSNFYWSEHAKTYTIALKNGPLIGLIRYWQKGTDKTTALVTIKIALPDYRNKGYGAEAQNILVKKLFDYFGFHNVEMYTDINNLAEQKCLAKLGFRFVSAQLYNDHGVERTGKLYRLTRVDYEKSGIYNY